MPGAELKIEKRRWLRTDSMIEGAALMWKQYLNNGPK